MSLLELPIEIRLMILKQLTGLAACVSYNNTKAFPKKHILTWGDITWFLHLYEQIDGAAYWDEAEFTVSAVCNNLSSCVAISALKSDW